MSAIAFLGTGLLGSGFVEAAAARDELFHIRKQVFGITGTEARIAPA